MRSGWGSTSNLDAKTRGRMLGKGKYGQIMEKALRPIIDSMITDMSKAMAKGHRSIGHGLDISRKNINEAEEAIRRNMRRHQDDRDAVHLKLGQRALDEDDLRDRHKKRSLSASTTFADRGTGRKGTWTRPMRCCRSVWGSPQGP